MNKLIIGTQIINFNYYYKRVFNPLNKRDNITNFNIPKIINKYYVIKSIYILQKGILEEYIENLEEMLNLNDEYRNIVESMEYNFFENKSITDIASFSYCFSRRNHLVLKIELDFIFTDIYRLIQDTFEDFLCYEDIKQIKNLYFQILTNNYYNNETERYCTGMFLYTDFKLNEIILTIFLKRKLYSIFDKGFKFAVYKNHILIFCSKYKEQKDYLTKIQNTFLEYYIYFKNQKLYNLHIEDIIFRNNVILENYSCILKDKTFEFIKWQLEQKIEQEIPLSASSEILLLEYITNKEFNIFKNNLRPKETEYYKKIKYYYDILVKNGWNN